MIALRYFTHHPKAARLGACAALSAALTASLTPGGHAPFALALLAAVPWGEGALAALAGTALGTAAFLTFSQALPHMASAILIFTAKWAFRGPSRLGRGAAAGLAGGLFLSVGGIYVLRSFAPWRTGPECLAATVLVTLGAYLFPELPKKESSSWGLLAAALLLPWREVTALSISPAVTILVLLSLLADDQGQRGLALGAVLDLYCSSEVYTAAFGLGSLLAAIPVARGWRAVGYFIGAGAALLHSTDAGAATLCYSTGLACLLYPALPLFGGKRVQKKEAPREAALAELWRRRMEGAARALREVYDSLGRIPAQGEENPAIVFDRAAERVCRECALVELCWQKEYTSTFNAMNDATPYLLERGRALPKDFPRHFADRCIHLSDFLSAVDRELSAFLLRGQYRREVEETRRSARGQYAQLSDLLSATAAGLGVSAAAPPCALGAALRPREGERVCGDTVVSFPTDEGKWCLLLSDGCGSGEEARKESALMCRLLRQFLESGIDAGAALRTLNDAMALRGAESGSFTTVDLCLYDPQGREAVLYKYGAAPTYLKKGGSVRRIAGSSLPVGLRGTGPDCTSVPVSPGSFLVQVSDGVADSERDEWLQNLLAGWEGEDPQQLSSLILSGSLRERRGEDDCAVQILYCPKDEVQQV